MLKVTSIVRAYDSLSLVTPAVASPSDLDILRNFTRKSLPTGTPFEVALPSSTSFIKILDVPYFDPKGLKITQEALEKALCTSVHAEVFAYLSTKPRIDRNSAHSTSCTVYCNIWDSQQGTHAKKALGQPIFLAGRSCAIRPAARHTGVPLCQRCWTTQHVGCCKGNAKAKPPVPPTPRNQPCPHNGRCVNCHKDPAANSASCKFWAHRYNREWIMAEYCQNVHHTYAHIDTLLEICKTKFDILFFQETPWNFIRHAPSTTTMEGDEVIGAPKHPDWLQMVRIKEGEVRHVIAYVSTRLSRYRPAMRRDIVDHRDILVLSLFSGGEVLNLMNIYSDNQHTAIEHLTAHVHSLPPFIYMAGDFNCVSMTWDDYEHGESSTAISLRDTASQIGLEWARPSNHGPTRISPNPNQRSNVLDLLAHSTESKPTKRSKSWWTDKCLETFGVYQLSHSLADYNKFKKACKDAKRDFFDEHIAEIATSRKRPWDLMEWVKQRKLPPCEAICNGDQPCHDMDDLWDALHGTYNSASGREYDTSVLDELPDELVREWADFSEHELLSALKGCSNSSAPGPDHVTWVHLKELLKDKHVLALFLVLDGSPLAIYKHVHYTAWVLSELLKDVHPPNHEPYGSNA
ncbi:unnamed protein product [Cyclocybe aegerita]|uniref:Endonuclease/exonuclease/phosphatase domain-containing protein n=1 Tax=Cyclocybe aegerita TaxID=1973307 RepID=A0A8S0X064_CYCAE|nr:unnamed protein product [Cyclocybe aegerita]